MLSLQAAMVQWSQVPWSQCVGDRRRLCQLSRAVWLRSIPWRRSSDGGGRGWISI